MPDEQNVQAQTTDAPVEEKTKTVTLIGTDAEKAGNHTLFALDSSVVFVGGVANVPVDVAKKLKKAGYIE